MSDIVQTEHEDEYIAVLSSTEEEINAGALSALANRVTALEEQPAPTATSMGNRVFKGDVSSEAWTWWSQIRNKDWANDDKVLILNSVDQGITTGMTSGENPKPDANLKKSSPYIITQTKLTYNFPGEEGKTNGQNFTSLTNSYHELLLEGYTVTNAESSTPNFTPSGIIAYNKMKGCCGINGFFARVADYHFTDSQLILEGKTINNEPVVMGSSKSCGMGAIVERRSDYHQGRHGSSYSIGGEFVCYNNAQEDGPEGNIGYCGNKKYHNYTTWVNPLHLVGGGGRPVTEFIMLNGHSTMPTIDETGQWYTNVDGSVIVDGDTTRVLDPIPATEYELNGDSNDVPIPRRNGLVANGGYNGIVIGASAMAIKKRAIKKYRKELVFDDESQKYVYKIVNGNPVYIDSDDGIDVNGNIIKGSDSHFYLPPTSKWPANHFYMICRFGYENGVGKFREATFTRNGITAALIPDSTQPVQADNGITDESEAIVLLYPITVNNTSYYQLYIYFIGSNGILNRGSKRVLSSTVTVQTSTNGEEDSEDVITKRKILSILNSSGEVKSYISEKTGNPTGLCPMRRALEARGFSYTAMTTTGNGKETAGITTENWTQSGTHGYTVIRNGYSPRLILSRGRIINEAPAYKLINPKGATPVAIASMVEFKSGTSTVIEGGAPYLDFKTGAKSDFYENPEAENASDLIPKENPTDVTKARVGYNPSNSNLNISSVGAIQLKTSRAFTTTSSTVSEELEDGSQGEMEINTTEEDTSSTSASYTFNNTGIIPDYEGTSSTIPEINLGSYTNPWNELFTIHSPIVLTSGSTVISPSTFSSDFSKKAFLAWETLQYKILVHSGDSIKHIGLSSTDIINAFSAQGLSATDYGLVGVTTVGNKTYRGIRYEECLAMEAAYLRYKLSQINTVLPTVTFKNYDNSILATTVVISGQTATYPLATSDIIKPNDENYSYSFDGWSDSLNGDKIDGILTNITANKTVYAHFLQTALT